MKGFEFGEMIGRKGLAWAVCVWLAEIAGGVRWRRVLAALVGVIAAGVWMNGGLREMHWPQFLSWQPVIHPWQKDEKTEAKAAPAQVEQPPSWKKGDMKGLDYLIEHSR
jgi:hypothetical protein